MLKDQKRLLGTPFERFLDNAITMSETSTQVHALDSYCLTSYSPRGSRQEASSPVSMTYRQLIDADNLCPRCCTYSLGSPGTLPDELVRVASYLLEMEAKLKRVLKVREATSASAVQSRIGDVTSIARTLEEYSTGMVRYNQTRPLDFPSDLSEALHQLATEFEAARDTLANLAKSDDTRSKVNAKVKALMVPKRFVSQDIQLDQEMRLVGISPTPTYRGNQVGAVLDAYAIRKDSATVLYAPGYVYSFLLQQLFSKSTSQTLVVSAPAPDDPALRETAAGLWDPEGESSLACMQVAIDSAIAL